MAGNYPVGGFALSLVGGILILIEGLIVAAAGAALTLLPFGQVIGIALIALGLVFGIIVIVGAILMRNPGKVKTGSILVLVFSILSLIIGGGFIIGFILGLVGGILGLVWKPPRPQPAAVVPPPPPPMPPS